MPRKFKVKPKRRIMKKSRRTTRRKKVINYCSNKILKFGGFQNMPLPARMRTKFKIAWAGYSGTGGVTGNGLFDIKMNSLHYPFNSANPVTSNGFSLAPGYPAVTAWSPIGFNSLCNVNLYQKYRVYASKISILASPSSIVDQMLTTITPSDNSNSPVDCAHAQQQPHTVSTVFCANRQPRNPNGLTKYLSVADLAGTTRRAVEDDITNTYSAFYNADPSYVFNWVVCYSETDNSAFTNPMELNIKVTYYVELFFLAQANLLQS